MSLRIGSLRGRHFIDGDSVTRDEIEALLDDAAYAKRGGALPSLLGKSVGLVFFNPSLRTRASMDVAVHRLGGHPVSLEAGSQTWALEWRKGVVMDGDKPEHLKEAAGVLSRYFDGLGVRAFAGLRSFDEDAAEPVISSFVKWSRVPVVNLESALYHPCQGLADGMTLRELLGNPLAGAKVLLTWAPHPKPLPMAVPNSFALVATKLGARLTILRPNGFDLSPGVMERARFNAAASGGSVETTDDAGAAYAGARIVYAKSWGALDYYGRWDSEKAVREANRSFTVDAAKMAATDGARFMHCLPVRRNVVVMDEVLDSPASAVLEQAENRMWAQMSLLSAILGEE